MSGYSRNVGGGSCLLVSLPSRVTSVRAAAWVIVCLCAGSAPAAELKAPARGNAGAEQPPNLAALRLAIEDLSATFGPRYPRGLEFLTQLGALENADGQAPVERRREFARLQHEALLANPLLEFNRLLVVKRASRPLKGSGALWTINRALPAAAGNGLNIGMPSNHECNSSLPRDGWDNELAVLSPIGPKGHLTTLYRPGDGGYVGEVDLHWDADRMLFTKSDAENWKIWELRADGAGLRQVTRLPADVDCMDACYLPNGRILSGSTASYQSVPCWHGLRAVNNLYLMDADGANIRQICFDQDHNFHPVVLPDGQVLYHRWEYAGINHIFLRQLMVMNPDGTGQRAVYGSSSWYPNSLYFPRPLPGAPGRLVSILSGYHGVHRMGQFVVLDTGRGWHEAAGIVRRISGKGDPIEPKVRDNLVDEDWPKFLHPFPLSEKYFLVACLPGPKANWGIYLADVFDNLVLVREEPGYALLEPVPLKQQPKPPVIPERVDLARRDAEVYLHDVHAGPGLSGVPRGTVTSLRVVAYDFGYRGLAGPDRIGYGGPWEVMRILGTVPLEADGSAFFRVPAKTPITVQALDAEGKAVQLMRSWFSAQPGERLSCIGCHDRPADAPKPALALAARGGPCEITPWHGPARGFDFAREVQPVLDRRCASCHDGRQARPDLRREELVGDYQGRLLSDLAIKRLNPQVFAETQGRQRYSPAYDALVPYVRRVNIEDDVSMLVPGEFHAHTSPLIQLLRKGHEGVQLTAEEMDRFVTWIDLNGPCHGTWSDVRPIPEGAHERRLAMRKLCGGPEGDPEVVPPANVDFERTATPATSMRSDSAGGSFPLTPTLSPQERERNPPRDSKSEASASSRARTILPPLPKGEGWGEGKGGGRVPQSVSDAVRFPVPTTPGWPFTAAEARQRQAALGAHQRAVDLGGGATLKLTLIPAGEFVMGDPAGEPDERPLARVAVRQPFWMSACEVSNEQFRQFDPGHSPRYYGKRHDRSDDQGLPLDTPRQPVVRVSWDEAMAFCRWLSERSGLRFRLPTEAEWEWACRAGSATALSFGDAASDFSAWANVGDQSFTIGQRLTGGLEQLALEGAALADTRFDDRATVTAPVGGYQPNAWGLYDLHGNAAEWTLTTYRPYPYREDDGRSDPAAAGRKVVRGGSFFDAPKRCRSAFRLDYPAWQRVFNVGFRVVCETKPTPEGRITKAARLEPPAP